MREWKTGGQLIPCLSAAGPASFETFCRARSTTRRLADLPVSVGAYYFRYAIRVLQGRRLPVFSLSVLLQGRHPYVRASSPQPPILYAAPTKDYTTPRHGSEGSDPATPYPFQRKARPRPPAPPAAQSPLLPLVLDHIYKVHNTRWRRACANAACGSCRARPSGLQLDIRACPSPIATSAQLPLFSTASATMTRRSIGNVCCISIAIPYPEEERHILIRNTEWGTVAQGKL